MTVNPTGQLVFVSCIAFLHISLLHLQSQSYCLSEGSKQLPKGDTPPVAAVETFSRPPGSGQPEAPQPVSTFPPPKLRYDWAFFWAQNCSPLTCPVGPSTTLQSEHVISRHYVQAGDHCPWEMFAMTCAANIKMQSGTELTIPTVSP